MAKFFLYILLLCGLEVASQEIRCELTLNTDQIKSGTTQLGVFTALETQIREFINQTRWTDDVFKDNERIELSILITLSKVSNLSSYEGQLQIRSVRPVFNSGYNSPIISYRDKEFNFIYAQNEVLNFNIQNSSASNLTAVLAYYVYTIIGYDYDTYSLNGGDPYFTKAREIANQNQNSGYPGWSLSDRENTRSWINQNIVQPRYAKLNDCLYIYHREGLDQMYTAPTEARKRILFSLKILEKIYIDTPDLLNIQIFFNAKSNEIIGIFKEGSAQEKKEVVKLLNRMYPSNSQNWRKINS